MTASPTLPNVIGQQVADRLARINTAMPGRVESYDAATGLASVQPLVPNTYVEEGERIVEDFPVVPRVPIVFPGSGGARIRFPVNVGDTVLLVFTSVPMDRWKSTGRKIEPSDDSRFAMSNAVAFPGLLHALSDASPMIEFTPTEIRAGGSNKLVTKAEFDAHVHTCAGSGSPSSTPTNSPITGTASLRG